jgi:hypothetical protein
MNAKEVQRLTDNPGGCQMVAGGRRPPVGWRAKTDPIRVAGPAVLALFRSAEIISPFSGGIASLNPRLLSGKPSACGMGPISGLIKPNQTIPGGKSEVGNQKSERSPKPESQLAGGSPTLRPISKPIKPYQGKPSPWPSPVGRARGIRWMLQPHKNRFCKSLIPKGGQGQSRLVKVWAFMMYDSRSMIAKGNDSHSFRLGDFAVLIKLIKVWARQIKVWRGPKIRGIKVYQAISRYKFSKHQWPDGPHPGPLPSNGRMLGRATAQETGLIDRWLAERCSLRAPGRAGGWRSHSMLGIRSSMFPSSPHLRPFASICG